MKKTSRARANVLLAAAIWTVYVWVTRMWNIARDPAHDVGFKAVHSALAIISVAFAVAVAVIGLRMRREAVQPSARPDGGPGPEAPEGPGGGPGDPEGPGAASASPDGGPGDRQGAIGR